MKKTIFRTMLLAFGASRGEEAARLEEIIKVFNEKTGYNVVYEGLLYCLTRKENMLDLDEMELKKIMLYANTVSALCVTKRGGLPALPAKEEVEELFNKVQEQK